MQNPRKFRQNANGKKCKKNARHPPLFHQRKPLPRCSMMGGAVSAATMVTGRDNREPRFARGRGWQKLREPTSSHSAGVWVRLMEQTNREPVPQPSRPPRRVVPLSGWPQENSIGLCVAHGNRSNYISGGRGCGMCGCHFQRRFSIFGHLGFARPFARRGAAELDKDFAVSRRWPQGVGPLPRLLASAGNGLCNPCGGGAEVT